MHILFIISEKFQSRDGEWTQTLAGLIPSLALQQHRLALQRQKKEQVIEINHKIRTIYSS